MWDVSSPPQPSEVRLVSCHRAFTVLSCLITSHGNILRFVGGVVCLSNLFCFIVNDTPLYGFATLFFCPSPVDVHFDDLHFFFGCYEYILCQNNFKNLFWVG